jgi:hypothetical protein
MPETVEINGVKFTQIGTSRYKQIPMKDIPVCQARYLMMGDCEQPGEFDAKTIHGAWADLCPRHLEEAAVKNSSLGYHRMKS